MGKRRIVLSILTVALAVAIATPARGGEAREAADGMRTVRITLQNRTEHQVFSPPLIAVGHAPGIFRLGQEPSRGIRFIAEIGDSSVLAAALKDRSGVTDVVALEEPILPGESATVTLRVGAGYRLSVATMLVQTNDGFTGVSALPLDSLVGTVGLRSFDAGSERNNELAEFVPGPPFGGMRRAPEHGVVMYHRGIQGVGDLDPATYDWEEPAAALRIMDVS